MMEDGDANIVDMERQAHIMELAQQQQMALQRLDEVVQNQQNLRDNIMGHANNNDEARDEEEDNSEQDEVEEVENRLLADIAADIDVAHAEEEEEGEDELPQPGLPAQNNQTQQQQQRLRRQRERHEGGGGGQHYFCSITQIYFTLSAFLAFLAVITSPSNVLFTSVRVSVTNSVFDQLLQHDNAALKLEEGGVAVDSNGNMVEKVVKKGEWEAVVAHKRTSLAEIAKEKNEVLQHHPHQSHSSSSWTGMLTNFAGEMRDHFIQQYMVLQQAKLQLSLAHSPPPPLDTSQASSAAAATIDTKLTSSSSAARWLLPWEWMKQKRGDNVSLPKNDDSLKQSDSEGKIPKPDYRRHGNVNSVKLHSILSPMLRVIDPSLIQSLSTKQGDETIDTSATPGEKAKSPRGPFMTILDKIFTSTPRLIAMANLLLAVTYLLQTAVADVFLGPIHTSNTAGDNNPNNIPAGAAANLFLYDASRRRRAGRERFGGFLLFKLLLVSAVLEPDSVDLFILLLWYTLLSFLRSLAHLAGTTANHASQSGERPSPGALRLLMLVMMCDTFAAVGCVALFHSTGWNMILLLTCDCVLLGVDAAAHIARYVGAIMEEVHRVESSHLEERQLELYAQRREQLGSSDDESSGNDMEHESDEVSGNEIENESNEVGRENRSDLHAEETESIAEDNSLALEDELHQIDQAVEIGDTAHQKILAQMGTAIFSLEMFSLLVTISHLLHIWALHGTSFGLVDGVLALHLHSTISLIGKKIAERRNAHRIAKELDSNFPEASDIDIRKASAAGDVCCICLNSMLVGSVKKVGCGHLMHTNCLREVVERERSFAAAKCPLCRASLVTGRHEPHVVRPQVGGLGNNGNNETNNPNNNDGAVGAGAGADDRQAQPAQPTGAQLGPGEQSLLRFSTENILPAWIPVPAFAFEVVRRETPAVVEPDPNPDGGGGWQRFFRRGGQVQVEDTNNNNDDNNNQGENDEQVQPQEQQEQEPQGETSFWRRLLILVGAIPMSPEEEAMALEQLVDMFPQYDRADLLRELRARRSAEAVAESILLGLFSGVARGGVD